MILDAYTRRGSVAHGETDPALLQAANEWFGGNELHQLTLASWAIQRVLRLDQEIPDFNPSAYIASVPNSEKKEIARIIMGLSLFWADKRCKEIMTLNPTMW